MSEYEDDMAFFEGGGISMADVILRHADKVLEDLRGMAEDNIRDQRADDTLLLLTHTDIRRMMLDLDLPVIDRGFRAMFINSFNEVMMGLNRDVQLAHVSKSTKRELLEGLMADGRHGSYILADAYMASLLVNERDKRFVLNKIGYAHQRAQNQFKYVTRVLNLQPGDPRYVELMRERSNWGSIAHAVHALMQSSPNGAPLRDLSEMLRLRDDDDTTPSD